MEFGQIIKKAWDITWRYRYLWILGLFAGVTGPGGGGGSTGSGTGNRNFGTGSGSGSSPFSASDMERFLSSAQHWLPIVVAVIVVWILIGFVIWLLSLAAQGGLIWAVNEIEEGRKPALRDAWSVGFRYMWKVLGLGLLLALPVLVILIVMGFVIVLPLVAAFSAGGAAAAAAIVPVCGALIIGVPLLIVLSFILGVMQVLALRRIVLDDGRVVESAKQGWITLRTRFKDTGLMWLISWGLNIAASLVLAVPIILITLALVFPAIFAGVAQSWGTIAGIAALWLLVVLVFSFAYTAIWGTFTSALWTIFYRRLTGREVVPKGGYIPPSYAGTPPVAPAYPGAPPQGPYGVPGQPAPPMAPQPAQQPAPPMAPQPAQRPAPPMAPQPAQRPGAPEQWAQPTAPQPPAPQPSEPPSAFDPHTPDNPMQPTAGPDA